MSNLTPGGGEQTLARARRAVQPQHELDTPARAEQEKAIAAAAATGHI